MTTFYIQTTAQWQIAISDSTSMTPQYTTYALANDLFFDSSINRIYKAATTGQNDADYINLGPNQTFDGNGYTITISGSAAVPGNGLAGIFRGAVRMEIMQQYKE